VPHVPTAFFAQNHAITHHPCGASFAVVDAIAVANIEAVLIAIPPDGVLDWGKAALAGKQSDMSEALQTKKSPPP